MGTSRAWESQMERFCWPSIASRQDFESTDFLVATHPVGGAPLFTSPCQYPFPRGPDGYVGRCVFLRNGCISCCTGEQYTMGLWLHRKELQQRSELAITHLLKAQIGTHLNVGGYPVLIPRHKVDLPPTRHLRIGILATALLQLDQHGRLKRMPRIALPTSIKYRD